MKKVITLLLALVISVGFLTGCGSNAEEIDWENITLGDILPTPQSNMMELLTNDDEWLSVYVHDMSENDFLEYQRWCKDDKGFSIDIEGYGDSFYGYNQQGYYLTLFYDDSQDKLHISLETPIPLTEYDIPEYAISAGLPMPYSKLGSYNWENDDSFFLYVGKTNMDAYKAYKDAVVSAGFIIEPYEGETFYSGDNANGYHISIGYEGYDTIKIEFRCPDDIANNGDASNDELVNTPTEAYIIACLNATPTVTEAIAVTAQNDPNGDLGTDGGYYSAVFFSVDLINQDDIYGDDLIDKGTDAGGCIEAYATVEDAEARNDYLSQFDDSILFNAGYHTVVGTLVIRTSKELTEDEQETLEENIIATFTSGEIVEPVSTTPIETEQSTPTETDISTITVTMSEDEFIGMLYTDAESKLREMGFANFEYKTLDTEDPNEPDDTIGAVEIKRWIFGKGDFEKGDSYDTDAIVVLWYYICDEPIPNLTVENCADLAALVQLKNPADSSVADFARQYSGRVIEFDACVQNIQNHGDYTTRWDVLLGCGDFDPDVMRGPAFRLTDVNYYDMGLDDTLRYGDNVRIIARVDEYDSNREIFELDIIQVTHR